VLVPLERIERGIKISAEVSVAAIAGEIATLPFDNRADVKKAMLFLPDELPDKSVHAKMRRELPAVAPAL
jgi:hypothetical protein